MGGVVRSLRRRGRAMPIRDSMIATTGLLPRLTVVTRTVKDFEPAGCAFFSRFVD